MTEGQGSDASPHADEPPRMVLYALYAVLVMVLLAVFVIVGVYGV